MDPKPDSKNLTPEERLFKVIQENEASGKADDTVVVRESLQEPREEAPKRKLPARFGFGRRREPRIRTGRQVFRPAFSVHALNGVLGIVLLAALSYFIVGEVIFRKPISNKFMTRAQGQGVLEIPQDLFAVREVEDSREALAERNIFQPYRTQEKSRPAPAPEASAAPPSNLSAIAATMKLTGTFLSDPNEALIELLDEKRTVYVPQGGTIKGVTVKEIRSDAVVLTDGTAEHTLQ